MYLYYTACIRFSFDSSSRFVLQPSAAQRPEHRVKSLRFNNGFKGAVHPKNENVVIVYSHADGKTGEVSSSSKHFRSLTSRQGCGILLNNFGGWGLASEHKTKPEKWLRAVHLVHSIPSLQKPEISN